ncbi:hypothetical protein RA27_21980 [Ruegeria sp. ANG-R]|uniref:hypothetical protein n=1 Tax=Ruegeria sp. ANG-R TaxID=1577903 RepID=UPI000580885D|nr:hypothetical protein [Ruegeria sp. ANG-R]KIC36646.1 hypothetical protein RA27_21980 [Ruegeria sp. ANG-R]
MNQSEKPIIPQENMTLYQRQLCGQRFKDQVIKGLNPLLKGTGWKRKSAWVFKVDGDWYLTAFITGGTTPDGMENLINVELGIKPMAVDPIYWKATGLSDNIKKPPSFRSNAAFKMPALPMAKQTWDKNLTDVEQASTDIFNAITGMAGAAIKAIKSKTYSELVSEHENADRYQTLFWCSLIAEGKGSTALEKMRAHYFKDGQEPDAQSQAAEILEGFRSVIEGKDAAHGRHLTTDIYGNQKIP